MIKLSSLLEHILDHPMKGEAIQEAKRLEDNESDPLTCLEITHEYEVTEGESVLWVIEITRDSDPFDSFGTIEFYDREEAKKALSMLRAACPEHHVSMFYSLNEDTTDHPDPDVSNTELKPLKFDDREDSCVFIEVDKHGYCRESLIISSKQRAIGTARNGYSIVQVMQPDTNGNCPTQCVYPPDREHEWVIFNPDYANDRLCWLSSYDAPTNKLWWCDDPLHFAERFPTYVEAEACIERLRAETSYITNAFPWPIPKLSEK